MNVQAEFMRLDLGSLQSVKDFSLQFLSRKMPLRLAESPNHRNLMRFDEKKWKSLKKKLKSN